MLVPNLNTDLLNQSENALKGQALLTYLAIALVRKKIKFFDIDTWLK